MTHDTITLIKVGRRKRQRRWLIVTGLLTIMTLALSMMMLMLGNTIHPVGEVIRALFGESIEGVSFTVTTLRLPRMLAAILVGFAFGIAGDVFQTMLRNPLANPNVLGVTTGASMAAVFCIVILGANNSVISTASIIGGLATVIVMYVLSRGKSFSIGKLILIGIGIQAMLNAAISYMMLISAEQDIPSVLRWLNGSLNGVTMSAIPPIAIAVAILVPLILLFSRSLSMLELGEQMATTLGVRTDLTRVILILGSVAMISIATSITGPIAFISFLAGPIAKRLAGPGFSSLLPAGLVGIVLVLASDLVGQFAFATRYPVGVITGIIGAPYLIYLLIRMNQKGEL
ncbi:iron chelate uptake ABC transporter family permease subunit [Salinicoccus cyprini]|uniref:Iron chelate uptake ABC transporter family permease subunit n=1 Tax=Salinicoccus cyprini TaxID=2493691 RepID=A0A558AXJ9_9STAP|nr:iron chelate uptake ABC transporter family permease subunit [Salinicoccus cyprini]TVT28987.1 iron chelate uptake ABC transporter family permease subunit [Salinicoccus cyprini]